MLATYHNSPRIFQEVSRKFFRGSLANAWENMAEDALRKVCEVFGFGRLNKHQEKALQLVVESKSDVFVNLPTGFGKSVVFPALPVVYSHVQPSRVCPLVNLMKDQVSRLTSHGISAVSLSDICSDEEMRSIEKESYSIVYGSPESWLGETRCCRAMVTKVQWELSLLMRNMSFATGKLYSISLFRARIINVFQLISKVLLTSAMLLKLCVWIGV